MNGRSSPAWVVVGFLAVTSDSAGGHLVTYPATPFQDTVPATPVLCILRAATPSRP